ncbi:tyrosine-protein phosphatase [soil metagenome]
MIARHRPLATLDNFRDYGDYPTASGRRVKAGRLFRSANHARLSEDDLAQVAGCDIGTVVDLRRPVERTGQPSRRPAGWTGRVLENDLDTAAEAPHMTFLKSADLTPDSGRQFMTALYAEMAFTDAHIDLFRRYFMALGEADRPVLIHCAAGKDRTGLLAALTHHLLGVHPDDMMADYLLTNVAVDLDARAPGIARALEKASGKKAPHDAVVAFLGVEPAYLDGAFASIAQRHGSVDAYLEQALGVDGALRTRIGERLTE